jgi:hypothetical protein
MRCGLLDATYPGRVTYETKNAGDMLVRAGAVVFIIGALGTLATVAPLLLGSDPLPTVGFALALGGLLRTALAQRPRAGQAASER